MERGTLTLNEITSNFLPWAGYTAGTQFMTVPFCYFLLLKKEQESCSVLSDGDVPTWDRNSMQGHHLHPVDRVPEGEVGRSQQRRWAGQPLPAGKQSVSRCPDTPRPRLVPEVAPLPRTRCCRWGDLESGLSPSLPPASNSTRERRQFTTKRLEN